MGSLDYGVGIIALEDPRLGILVIEDPRVRISVMKNLWVGIPAMEDSRIAIPAMKYLRERIVCAVLSLGYFQNVGFSQWFRSVALYFHFCFKKKKGLFFKLCVRYTWFVDL